MNQLDLDRLLHVLANLDGSGPPHQGRSTPRVRINGQLRTLEGEPDLTDTRLIAEQIMQVNVLQTLEEKHEADFAYSVCRAWAASG